jgi:hypothetical protein
MSCASREKMGEKNIKECSTIFIIFLRCVARFERRDGIFEVMKRLTFAMKSPSS